MLLRWASAINGVRTLCQVLTQYFGCAMEHVETRKQKIGSRRYVLWSTRTTLCLPFKAPPYASMS
jgi:hypothetical protein